MRYEDMLILARREEERLRKRRRPVQHEEDLQGVCVRWFDDMYPELRLLLFHTANEGKVTVKQGARRKRMGVRAGVADLILLVSRGGYSCLCVELKYRYNSQSEAQKAWQEAAEAFGGAKYVVVKDKASFMQVVEEYLGTANSE